MQEGNPKIRATPDAMVVFGRPPGHLRGALTRHTRREMQRKLRFCECYGVEEYYEYDPDRGALKGWLRRDDRLEPVSLMEGWISPRLRIRFHLQGADLMLYRPDGRRFETFIELDQRVTAEHQRAERLAERLRALGIDPDERD